MTKKKLNVLSEISLAPIHEYTDAPFRLLCQRHGCKTTFVPLVNVTALTKGKLILDVNEKEKSVHVQLSGSNPNEFKEAVRIIERKFPNIKGFNINAGCPSYTTTKTGAGSALMREKEKISKIIKKCKDSTSLPVSVKTRIFIDEQKTIEFYKIIENVGCDFLIIHGRTVKQGYSGIANWSIIHKAKQSLSIPVIGNGDVTTLSKANQLIENGFCDGVMIGRAALQNPMLFEGKDILTENERKGLTFEYYKICEELEIKNLNSMKLVSTQLLKGIKDASKIRNSIMKSKSINELLEKLNF